MSFRIVVVCDDCVRHLYVVFCVFFFQAEDGIRDLVRSRGLGDVYKRQATRSREGPSGSRRACGPGRPARPLDAR